MHTSLSGFALSESIRKSTKLGCFCRIANTSFFSLSPACSVRPAFDWHSTIRANMDVSPSSKLFFEICLVLRRMPILASGDLHPSEIQADHQTTRPLEALPGREQACATVLLERGGKCRPEPPCDHFRDKECHESIIGHISPLLLSNSP